MQLFCSLCRACGKQAGISNKRGRREGGKGGGGGANTATETTPRIVDEHSRGKMISDGNKHSESLQDKYTNVVPMNETCCTMGESNDLASPHSQKLDSIIDKGSKRVSFLEYTINSRFSLEGFLDPRRESDSWPARFSFGTCSPKRVGKLVKTWGQGICKLQPYVQNLKFVMAVARWMLKLLKFFLLYKVCRWIKDRFKLLLFSKAFYTSLRKSCASILGNKKFLTITS